MKKYKIRITEPITKKTYEFLLSPSELKALKREIELAEKEVS